MPAERIFHVTEPALWDESQASGTYVWSTRGQTLDQVGYLHGSYRHQAEAVADAVYADHDGELVLLEIDPDQVPAEIRVEQLDDAPGAFPHVYGPLPVAAVTAVHPMARVDGRWTLPPSMRR